MSACSVLAVLLLAHPLAGQAISPDVPPIGTRVRVRTPTITGRSAAGRLNEVNDGLIAIALRQRGSTLEVPWSRISTVDVFIGRDGTAGAVKGMFVGLAASSVVYPALSTIARQQDAANNSRTIAAVVSFALLPAGAAVVGWLNGPERWQPMTWRPTADVVMADGEATRLRLAAGSEVLVRAESRRVKARVVEATADTLVLQRASEPLRFAWSDVNELSFRGGRNRTKGAALGFSLMAGVSAVMIAAGAPVTVYEKQQLILNNLLVGAAVGTLIGTAGWSRVPLPVR